MSKKEKNKDPKAQEEQVSQQQEQPAAQTAEEPAQAEEVSQEQSQQPSQEEQLRQQIAQQEDRFLRLAAEYDNYRKRTAKEKESIWSDAKADTAVAFLPVYDNLERALKQDTADEAYKKGVEMTMSQLKEVFAKLGVTEIPALGEAFDPNFHNAVMHVEDENLAENTVAEVFQTGFMLGEKVIRFAMVKVAN